jgi:hypothetical protein
MKITLNSIIRILSIFVLLAMIYQIIEEQKQLKDLKIKLESIQKQSDQIDKFLNNNYIMENK